MYIAKYLPTIRNSYVQISQKKLRTKIENINDFLNYGKFLSKRKCQRTDGLTDWLTDSQSSLSSFYNIDGIGRSSSERSWSSHWQWQIETLRSNSRSVKNEVWSLVLPWKLYQAVHYVLPRKGNLQIDISRREYPSIRLLHVYMLVFLNGVISQNWNYRTHINPNIVGLHLHFIQK